MTRAPLQFLDNKTPFGDLCDVQEEMLQTLGAWKHHLVGNNMHVHQRLPIIITMCTPLVYCGSIHPRDPAIFKW